MNQDLMVFSRDNLPNNNNNIKNGAYVINLDEYRDIGTRWVELHVNNKTAKETMKFIRSKELGSAVGSHRQNMITNIFRIQAYDSIMCSYFCIGFICFMFNGNSLTDNTSLFSPNDFKKNDDIILKYFKSTGRKNE